MTLDSVPRPDPLHLERCCLLENLVCDGNRIANVGFRESCTCVGGRIPLVNESTLIVRGEGSATLLHPVTASAPEHRIHPQYPIDVGVAGGCEVGANEFGHGQFSGQASVEDCPAGPWT